MDLSYIQPTVLPANLIRMLNKRCPQCGCRDINVYDPYVKADNSNVVIMEIECGRCSLNFKLETIVLSAQQSVFFRDTTYIPGVDDEASSSLWYAQYKIGLENDKQNL